MNQEKYEQLKDTDAEAAQHLHHLAAKAGRQFITGQPGPPLSNFEEDIMAEIGFALWSLEGVTPAKGTLP